MTDELNTADDGLPTEPLADTEVTPYQFKVTTQTEAPNTAIDRLDMGNFILSHVDWDGAEERDKGKGPYHTTTQYSWLMEDVDDPSIRFQVSVSVNRVPKAEAKGKGPKAVVETEAFKLSNTDISALNAAIAKFKANNDIDNTVKLATIKSVWERDGRVSRKDFLIVAAIQ